MRLLEILLLSALVSLSGCGTEPLPESKQLLLVGRLQNQVGEPLSALLIDGTSGRQTTTGLDGSFNLPVLVSDSIAEVIAVIGQDVQPTVVLEGLPSTGNYEILLTYSTDTELLTARDPSTTEPDPSTTDPEEKPPSSDPPATAERLPSPGATSPFDVNGSTTAFEIPLGLTGNISAGRTQYRSRCLSCHPTVQSGRGYNFNRLKRTTAAPPMNLTLSNAVLADLTAYLNRP